MLNIAIFIYDDAEVLDFSGPFEVFSTANRVADEALFSVFLVAQNNVLVRARGGFLVQPHYTIDDHPAIDVLVVVGGVHNRQMHNRAVLDWLARQAASVQLLASVCTGVFLVAQAGVLERQRVTTHWQDISDLRHSFPNLEVIADERWVDTGKIISSGGISAGIDMSLHLVGRLSAESIAQRTAQQMEYQWR